MSHQEYRVCITKEKTTNRNGSETLQEFPQKRLYIASDSYRPCQAVIIPGPIWGKKKIHSGVSLTGNPSEAHVFVCHLGQKFVSSNIRSPTLWRGDKKSIALLYNLTSTQCFSSHPLLLYSRYGWTTYSACVVVIAGTTTLCYLQFSFL